MHGDLQTMELAMSMTVADFVLKRLREWGVQRVSATPGTALTG